MARHRDGGPAPSRKGSRFEAHTGAQAVDELRRMAAMGYEHVEMCSPSGYAPWSFGNLVKYSGKELAAIIRDAGLKCSSSHFTWNELNNNLDERIAFAQQMGLKHMVASGGLDGKTTDELKRKCEALNKIGEKITKAGMVAGYHNHNGEFENKKAQYDQSITDILRFDNHDQRDIWP